MARIARWLTFIVCVVVTMTVVSRAEAAAPFCDYRAMSANAPPPVMPARDVRLDLPSYTPPCVIEDFGVEEACASQTRTPSPSPDPPVLEAAALAAGHGFLPRWEGERIDFEATEWRELPSGHAPGVFHPPRS